MDTDLIELDPEQARFVGRRSGPTLALGAPGTGKTMCLIRAGAGLTAEVGPDKVLGIASSRAASRRWQAASARLVQGAAPQVMTVHALAARIVTGTSAAGDSARLLTAPEQESRIRQMLADSTASEVAAWPKDWQPALRTRQFARQLRRAVARVRGLGWDPESLIAEAHRVSDAGWVAIGQFTARYLQVLDWTGCLDYTEAVVRAVQLLEERGEVGSSFPAPAAVLVDELQDADPMQLRLLSGLLPQGGPLLAVADPHVSVFGFRGADLSVLARFAELPGDTEVIHLPITYRCPASVRDCAARLMGGRWYPGLGRSEALARPATAVSGPGSVQIRHFDNSDAQAAHIAALLRRERRGGTAWTEMAVLVRAPARQVPPLLRQLSFAGIPVDVPADDLPLARQPAVDTLLMAAQAVSSARSGVLDADDARRILLSPIGGLADGDLRRIERFLVRRGFASSPGTVHWGELLRDPAALSDLPPELRAVAEEVGRAGIAVARAAATAAASGPPAEILWQLWGGGGLPASSGSESWPRRLERQAGEPGATGAAAGRDLDALVRLFRLAERAGERDDGPLDLASFVANLRAQEIPLEPDAQIVVARDSVKIMSAFRARGLQWPVVVVCGFEEGSWPSAGRGSGLIHLDRLTPDELLRAAPPPTVAEERRLAYLAFTRASRVALLCAQGEDDAAPSRFLEGLEVPVLKCVGYPRAAETAEAVVARLLEARASVAADQIARLAAEKDPRGRPVFPAADPENWPGVRDWTRAPTPIRPPEGAVVLSPSAVSALSECPVRWFWDREIRAASSEGAPAQFGSFVHEAVADLINGASVDRGWSADAYEAAWHAAAERGLAREALARAATWLAERTGALTAEWRFDVAVPVENDVGGFDEIRLRGAFDAVEVDENGGATVWDFKTRRTKSTSAEVEEHAQLGAYQIAIRHGAAADLGARGGSGAGLVYLCVPRSVKEPGRPAIGLRQTTESTERLRSARDALRRERFEARDGAWCRTCEHRAICPERTGGSR